MRRKPWLALLVVAMLLPAVVRTPRAIAVERPPRLGTPDGCELWVGTSSGNDPSTQIELRLCPQPDGRVAGAIQWSSTLSGWNLRDVSGQFDAAGTGLTLRDDRIAAQRPEPGWRFCTVDRYTLARDGDHIRGRYHSAACTDDGTITLERSASAPPQNVPNQPAPPTLPGTPPPAPSLPPPAPSVPSPPAPPPPPSRGPFGCSV